MNSPATKSLLLRFHPLFFKPEHSYCLFIQKCSDFNLIWTDLKVHSGHVREYTMLFYLAFFQFFLSLCWFAFQPNQNSPLSEMHVNGSTVGESIFFFCLFLMVANNCQAIKGLNTSTLSTDAGRVLIYRYSVIRRSLWNQSIAEKGP